MISGIKNYYVKTDEKENVTLGTWHVLPEKLARIAENAEDYDYENALANSEYDVLIFFQGSGGLRHSGVRINFYRVLRKTFHIIVFDNRGNYINKYRGTYS